MRIPLSFSRAAPINSPSSMPPGPSEQVRGCQGDGCASEIGTWPLHKVYRGGVLSHLCNSCVLLAHRSYYCCSCFFLIPCPSLWPGHEEGNPFVSPPAPIATCQTCHEALAHVACVDLHANDGTSAFVCPACSAAAEGRPFTYAPPCGTPIDERGARVLVVGSQLALVLLQRSAAMLRAEAERLTQDTIFLRRRAGLALGVAMEFDVEDDPSWNVHVQPRPEAERSSNSSPPAQQLPELTIDTIRSVTELAMAATAQAVRDSLPPQPSFSVTGTGMAAAEANHPTLRTLQLFPVEASSSRTPPRTLQLFKDMKLDNEEN